MFILHNFIIFLAPIINKRWQHRNLTEMLETLLCVRNHIDVREPAFMVFIYFVEALGKLESPQTQLFSKIIDMTVFAVDENQHVNFRIEPVGTEENSLVILPSVNYREPKISCTLWDNLLSHLTNKPSAFGIWWTSLKEYYFSIFYPNVPNGAEISNPDRGFVHCPYVIQRITMTHLSQWILHPIISPIIWSSEEDIQLIVEIFRQSCELPISFSDVILLGITKFSELFLTKKYAFPLPQRIGEFQKIIIKNSCSLFYVWHVEDSVNERLGLCEEIGETLKMIFLNHYENLEEELRQYLLDSLLEITSQAHKLIDGGTRIIFHTLFFIWIHEHSQEYLHYGKSPRLCFEKSKSIKQDLTNFIKFTCTIPWPNPGPKAKIQLHPEQVIDNNLSIIWGSFDEAIEWIVSGFLEETEEYPI